MREAQHCVMDRKKQEQNANRVWKKPHEGWLKVNTDAAVFSDGTIGVGAVIRDSNGSFVGARCCKVAGAWSPREPEAISMKEALSWIIKRAISTA